MGNPFKAPKAPKAPDYAALGKSDAEEQRKTAQELTKWNRPNQTDQYGNQTSWTQDAAGNWTQSTTLDPTLKAQQDKMLGGFGGSLDQANAQGAWAPPDQLDYSGAGATPWVAGFDRSQGDRVAGDMYDSVMSRVRPEQIRESEAMDTKLRLQGLQPGTEAYNRAMQNLTTSHGDVTAKAGLDATSAGYSAASDIYSKNLTRQEQLAQQRLAGARQKQSEQEQRYNQSLTTYQQPLSRANNYQALLSGAPNPAFANVATATGYSPANMTEAAQAKFQNQMGTYSSGNAKKGNTLNAGASLGAAALMA